MAAAASPAPIAVARHPQPSIADAQELARELLGPEGTRLQHVRTAGFLASRLAVLFEPDAAELLVMAATLHDIGYSPRIARTGFHPLDGGAFLRAEGYPEQLAALVANHSLAILSADGHLADDLAEQFPREEGMLTDALAYADMHSAPDGRIIPVELRLADIAARHADRVESTRAQQLRAAMARVGAALLQVQVQVQVQGRAPVHAARAGASHGQPIGHSQWIDLRDWRAAGPDRTGPRRTEVLVAFDSWWSAELVYARELETCDPDGREAIDIREAALRLAHLRAVADVGRDRYFRHALA
jgi:hypothetical protein